MGCVYQSIGERSVGNAGLSNVWSSTSHTECGKSEEKGDKREDDVLVKEYAITKARRNFFTLRQERSWNAIPEGRSTHPSTASRQLLIDGKTSCQHLKQDLSLVLSRDTFPHLSLIRHWLSMRTRGYDLGSVSYSYFSPYIGWTMKKYTWKWKKSKKKMTKCLKNLLRDVTLSMFFITKISILGSLDNAKNAERQFCFVFFWATRYRQR